MAIIVDPDNLDRNQVIFGTTSQKISVLDVGTLRAGTAAADGASTGPSKVFTSATSTFQTDPVIVGDVICIFDKESAGHYVIESIDSETNLTISAAYDNMTAFTGATFEIRTRTGGTAADGVTLQALYSFSKIEWKNDSVLVGGDDLIRHEFPFEAITSEQMEIGGLAAHADWDWFEPATVNPEKDLTKKFVRTGGWQSVNTAGTELERYSGIVTLGALDADAQVYLQQTSTVTTPEDFKFQGAVNEPIFIFASGDDRLTYLKLFARKKARTYAQSQISDIGVTSLKTIVNRFPLAHAVDAAIIATDAEILATTPFRNATAITAGIDGTDGDPTESGTLFTSALSTFQTAGLAAGDTLRITSGAQQGYYTILDVPSETTLNIAPDFEVSTFAAGAESGLTFTLHTTYVVSDTSAQTHASYTTAGASEGIIETGTAGVGSITDTTGANFGSVAVGDILEITSSSANNGLYTVLDATTTGASNPTATVLFVDTTDQPFPVGLEGSVLYKVLEPGMYLQYKNDALTIASLTSLAFADAGPDTITRVGGSWISDGVTAGSVVTVAGSASNDGSYTVASRTALVLTLIATDTLVAEGTNPSATATAYDAFKRTIDSVVNAFKWRLSGNASTLSNNYQFVQHQLRQTTDIDYGSAAFRGDVTDLLMAYASPTATTTDMFIDNLDATDTNNVTYKDATGIGRTFPFVSVGTLNFNSNLSNDAAAEYWMFFTNDDAGDNTGRDFSTPDAIIVNDNGGTPIEGTISAASSVQFTFDYDNNVQRGAASASTDAPITVVAIGLATAQYVIVSSTITNSKTNSVSLVAALERNYSNP